MRLKEYQQRALDRVEEFVDRLADWRGKAEKVREVDPEAAFDWVTPAWESLAGSGPYLARRNGLGEPLPSFCLKVPTGGGKTLLAVKIIDRVNARFCRQRSGLVLWIVPTTQIYSQTLRALKDLDHPYRQHLDWASGRRTRVLEKTTGFRPEDVADGLCVLLLMLPSANRETRAQLRMFRDAGGFERFFPAEDDADAHRALRKRVPNLDAFEQTGGAWSDLVKTSLGNVLRLLQPLIILDEGHKAYSQNARATIEGFNPCMVVELSATPPKGANVLAEISGREVHAEEMIKLDLHIRNKASASWQDTLLAAVEHREALEAAAEKYEARSRHYIRPICLVQVERTGREQQRRSGVIHAEDVRDYLLRHPRISAEHIAVKTSSRDELKEVDQAGGLLSRDCPIRFIITKQALQEGWDCSFAYVLAILTNPASRSALTQLVGRILRQPYARKTHVPALDESYVYCFQRRGAELLKEVQRGFGREGLQGLEGRIVSEEVGAAPTLVTRQRERFRTAAAELVLPAFMIRDPRRGWRLVYYEVDILSRVPWDDVDVSPLFDLELDAGGRDVEWRTGLDAHPLGAAFGTHDPAAPAGAEAAAAGEDGIDYCFAAAHLLEAMPNPWRGAEAARRVFGALQQKHPHGRVAANCMFVLEELRKQLERERDRLSRQVFAELLDSGEMRFIVVADDLRFNRLPQRITVPAARRANREDGAQYERNLFDVVTEEALNGLENKVATYLDRQARLFFWYRNRSRQDYYVQGWKPRRIYADFILTLRPDEPDVSDEFHRVFVVETKGMHLEQSEDTTYKRNVFDVCSRHARRADWAEFVPAMRNKVMRFEIVDEREWEKRLNEMLAG